MWKEYIFSREVRDEIRLAVNVAVMYNTGATQIKAVTANKHLYQTNCSSLIKQYRIV